MMSDATGIGTGGTSALIAVGGGTKSDCLPTSASAPKFYLFLDPEIPTQCGTVNVSWGPEAVSPVSVYTMVIGGQSGALSIPSGASSVAWTANIRTNTTMMFVAGDANGPGTGGSSPLVAVGSGSSSCIDASSPSSTQRPPAGGINTAGSSGSTPTTAPSTSTGSGSSTNIGAIVGGVVGGVAALIMFLLVLLFFHRRRKHHRNSGTRPMKPDLIDPSEEQPAAPREDRGELPRFYEPEPFILPDAFSNPDTSSRHSLHSTHEGQPLRTSMTTASGAPLTHGRAQSRLSVTTMSDVGGAAPASSTGRKSGMAPSAFRAVNFIQHDDGGEADPSGQEPETVELPPAYTDVRSKVGGTSGATAAGSSTAPETAASSGTATGAETSTAPTGSTAPAGSS
ncbi:hypothetical protein BDV93DRAFT_134678 [Ceratobasidium sp. AG-I]|nr:hypothetical protein BDV93DRAFT_134678 [Ceratobasidium sp. AG-I]